VGSIAGLDTMVKKYDGIRSRWLPNFKSGAVTIVGIEE
jgi:hypothetical protein